MLIRNSAAYLLARGVPALVQFLGLALFTRLLSPSEYGTYALVLALTQFGYLAFFEWLKSALVRYRSRYDQDLATFLSTAAGGFLGVALAGSALALLAAASVSDPLGGWILGTWGLILCWSLFELVLNLKAAEASPGSYGILLASKAVLVVTLGGVLAWLGLGPEGVLAGYAAALLTGLGLFGRANWTLLHPERFDSALSRQMVRFGLPMTATFVLSSVILSSDRLILGWLDGVDAAGLYAAGYDLPNQALGVILMVVYLAAYPLALRALEQDDPVVVRERLLHHAQLMLAIGVPAAAGLATLAPSIAHLVLGTEFRAAAADLIPVITLASLLYYLKSLYFDLAFQISQKTLGLVPILATAASLNIVLNLLLIPPLGIHGAAYATLVSQAVGLGYSALAGRRQFNLPWPTVDSLKVLFATLLMVAAIWPLRTGTGIIDLTVGVALGALVYGLAMVAMDAAGSRSYLADRLRERP